jgi:hypothetical protein
MAVLRLFSGGAQEASHQVVRQISKPAPFHREPK